MLHFECTIKEFNKCEKICPSSEPSSGLQACKEIVIMVILVVHIIRFLYEACGTRSHAVCLRNVSLEDKCDQIYEFRA